VSRTPESAIAEGRLCAHTAIKMTQQPDHAPDEYAIPENIGEIRIFPRPIVWTAGMVILALAAIGLVQGVRGALTGGASGSGQEEETSTSGAVSAQAAQPLSGAAQWSALSGASVASSSAASAAPAAQSSSNDETQDESSDETPVVSAAAPPPPPAPNPQPASAAPQAQPQSAQPDTMPPT
jgi:hypothetical protein